MKSKGMTFLTILLLSAVPYETSRATGTQNLKIEGLKQPVEIITDKWGISHIYAKNQSDLFFAQGFSAARDRLFQFEIWRRKALGSLAEIQGEKAFAHDKGARLLRFRGNIEAEMAHYHDDGIEIIRAFVAGVNAYIKRTEDNPRLLPFEFRLLGFKPGYWTPEVVVSRHNALVPYGVAAEISLAKRIASVGEDKIRETTHFYRATHLKAFDGVDLTKISDRIANDLRASRSMPKFDKGDLSITRTEMPDSPLAEELSQHLNAQYLDPLKAIAVEGSNNWVLSGDKTGSGMPIMANDPHRSLPTPSLRYWVHLNAPGWNVIGGGEPVLPGVSIGHNDHGAWGLTVFPIDQEDLYVYQTNPDNPNQYRYNNKWTDMQIETTEIAVRGKGSVEATLKYSRHGPILYEDRQNRLAYGMRAAWLDIGATPYLASLRMDQATTWEEFREACSYSGLPGENMVWADKAGNIGWQSVGLAPVRFGWDGSLPVPGNGDYEWNGYIPITSMPHIENPEEGWYGTTNNHNIPEGYPNVFSNAYRDPARIFRLREVMNATSEHTVEDSMTLQYDKKSMTAESLAPLFQGLRVRGKLGEANLELTNWDYDMDRDSVAAAIYDQWELAMLSDLKKRVVPADNLDSEPAISKVKMLEWLLNPSEFVFGRKPEKSRDKAIIASLDLAVNKLEEMIGPDMHEWSLGKIHRADVIHPLSHLVGPELKAKINVAPLPRGGANNTLNVNWGNDRQLAGASFRIIVDTSDWDLARGTNSPGQSGNPDSPHYADLFKGWNEGDYFEVLYSRDRISAVASHVTHLLPGRK